jgi:glycogen synthase
LTDRLRILYAAGPGNVLGTYQHWKAGQDDPSEVAITYSAQFFDVCQALDAEGYILGSNRVPAKLKDGRFTIVHRPIPFVNGPGVLFHVGQIWAAIRLVASALWFRADWVIVANGNAEWFPLRLLPLFGVRLIPSLHNVLWCKRHLWGRMRGWLHTTLDGSFFARTATASMSVSREIAQQVRYLSGGRRRMVYEFLPTYRRSQFKGIGESPATRVPFRVFFAGRIERHKGVFDILEIARRYERAGRHDIEFDLCGDGSALPELKLAIADAGLSGRVRCHGHCDRQAMRAMFARSHVVLVPTSGEFSEGFNKVVAEGVLCGRPVITSSVCPALHYVRDALVEVPPDNIERYGDAILKLCEDLPFYEAKRAACRSVDEQFYDYDRSWGATLLRILRTAGIEMPINREADFVSQPACSTGPVFPVTAAISVVSPLRED